MEKKKNRLHDSRVILRIIFSNIIIHIYRKINRSLISMRTEHLYDRTILGVRLYPVKLLTLLQRFAFLFSIAAQQI